MQSSVPPPARDMFLPLRYPERAVPLVTHFRSLGTFTCLQILAARGLRDRYLGLLPTQHRAFLSQLLPAVWIESSTAQAHFAAVDGLGFTNAELLDLGTAAGEKMTASNTGTLLRMAREVGVTPWVLMPHGHRLWDRTCKGGDLSIEKKGPKEVLVTLHGIPNTASTYFRTMMRGVFQAGLAQWCSKGYVSEVGVTRTTITYREAWV